jgi:hypothetical protein
VALGPNSFEGETPVFSKSLVAILLCLCATTASAEILTCKQTKLSSSGFSTVKAAQSWFPKNFKIGIKGDEAISDVYGKGTAVQEGGRTNVTFVLAASNGQRTRILFTFVEKSKRFAVRLGGQSGYVQTAGSTGKCAVS